MSDEQRADWLTRALDDLRADGAPAPLSFESGREPEDLPGDAGWREAGVSEDTELADLLALAVRLQRLGPSMATIASAEASFDPAFAQRLKATVVAAYVSARPLEPAADRSGVAPGTQGQGISVGNATRAVAPSGSAAPASAAESSSYRESGLPRWAAFGSRLRSLWGLILLVVVAIVVAVTVAVNSAAPQPQRASARATVTIGARPFLMQRNAARTPNTRAMIAPSDPGPTATPGMVPIAGILGSPSGTVVPGSAPQPVAPGVVAGTPPHDTAQPRGTATPGPGFGLYSTGSVHPLAQSPRLAPTIPAHYRSPPRLPASAPSFALSYRPLGDAAVARIAATFPGLRDANPVPITLGRLKATRYTAGAEQLEIVPATGEVRYSQRPALTRGTLGAAAARDTAAQWLAAHALLPHGVATASGMVTSSGGVREVRFAPALQYPLWGGDGIDTTIGISVRLDGAGRVLTAERRWPSLVAAPSVALAALPRSIAVPSVPVQRSHGVAGTPTGPALAGPRSFEVDRVEIVYMAEGSGPTARLRPAYLLQGRLAMPDGTGRLYSVVTAGAAP